MDREYVDSSMITSIGYDAMSCTLEVEFKSGVVWQYHAHFISISGILSLTRTLFPVRCKSCFTLLFLTKPYHFDTFLLLVYTSTESTHDRVVASRVYENRRAGIHRKGGGADDSF